MSANPHETYMSRCLTLAAKGRGKTLSNPMVGAVLVYQGRIIGEGWHKAYGAPHAEVEAIEHCWEPDKISAATLYVSLEPCNHYGKTPPCTELILKHKIKKVVVGSLDPNPQVAGQGIARLKAAGCSVQTGILEEACLKLNPGFMKFHGAQRPFIHLKWAQSLDGFMAPAEKKAYWISHQLSKQWVHQMRTEHQAILIGIQTLLDDKPQLNVRYWKGKDPQICIIDPQGKSLQAPEIMKKMKNPWIFTAKQLQEHSNHFSLLSWKDLETMIQELYQQNIQSVLVEGGAKTLDYFLQAGLWDQVTVFKSQTTFGSGLKAPQMNITPVKNLLFATDQVLIYENSGSRD